MGCPPGSKPGDAADWARVRQVVESALSVPREEREAYLSATCGADEALLERARAMLAEDADDGYMDPPSAADFDLILDAHETVPSRVGAWELRRKVGEGGMGSVWEAVRADGAFRLRAAVKLVRPGFDSAEMLERFRRERQVLANLDHPGIARLLDGGATEAGLPYLVMEYVEGLPIDRYCDDNRLDTIERLELFERVCDAVDHAHRQLVVHRDLKPSNLLVTPGGEPKLLDFGIAKLLDAEKNAGVQVTQDVLRLMTPAYASPEQLRGHPVDTASDQYSLGVLLYRLLTGHLPLATSGRSPAELERLVTEEEPERPSRVVARTGLVHGARAGGSGRGTPELVGERRRTSPAQLSRSLRGDLDRIVLMALRKEPRRRYPSVASFAEDLRRHRSGRPVHARRDTWSYRAAKLLARNRLLVGLVGAVILSLSVGLAVAVRQYRRADAASELAVGRLAEVQQLNAELEHERDLADGLRRGAEQQLAEVERLNADLERERSLAQRRFGEVRGVATTLVFDLHDVVSRLAGGTAALELILGTGLTLLDRLAAESAGDPDLQRDLADAYLRMGDVRASHLGQTDQALACYERAGELCRALELTHPEDQEPAERLIRARTALGRTLVVRGETGAAVRALQQALGGALALQARAPADSAARVLEVEARVDLADALMRSAPPDEALRHLESTRQRLEELAAEVPDLPQLRASLARVHLETGHMYRRTARWDLALAEERRALELRVALAEEQPGVALVQRDLLLTRDALADTLMQAGSLDEALGIFLESRERYVELLALDTADLRAVRDVMIVEQRLGQLHSRRGALDEAVAVLESAIARARTLATADPANGLAQRELARVLFLWAAYERERLSALELPADGRADDVERGLLSCIARFDEAAELQAVTAEQDLTSDLSQERFVCHASAGQTLSALAGLPGRPLAETRARWARAERQFRIAIECVEEFRRRGGDSAQAGALIERLTQDAEHCASELETLDRDN